MMLLEAEAADAREEEETRRKEHGLPPLPEEEDKGETHGE